MEKEETRNFSFEMKKVYEVLNKCGTSVEQGKAGAEKRWKNSPPNSHPNAKERKGKEIKIKETDTTDIVTLETNEYQESISFLKKIDIDNIEFPDYAIENKKYWIEFILYWTEKGNNGKIRAEGEKTFEIKRRFYNWLSRAKVQYEKPKQTFNSIG